MIVGKSILTWLQEEIKIKRINTETQAVTDDKIKIVARIAELIAVNGGQSFVSGWVQQPTKNANHPYGRLGLMIGEALELIHLTGQIKGFLLCMNDDTMQAKVDFAIQQEINRIREVGGFVENSIERFDESEMYQFLKMTQTVDKDLRKMPQGTFEFPK